MSEHEHNPHAGLLKVLQEAVDEELHSEVIGGVALAEVLEYVDLDVAYSPVIPLPVDSEYPRPERLCVVELVKRGDGRYELRRRTEAGPTFEILDPEQVVIMRGRYLLCRDHFARTISQYSYSDRQRILADFFPQGLWTR